MSPSNQAYPPLPAGSPCPDCGSTETETTDLNYMGAGVAGWAQECKKCRAEWNENNELPGAAAGGTERAMGTFGFHRADKSS
jgi:hypothetical protein